MTIKIAILCQTGLSSSPNILSLSGCLKKSGRIKAAYGTYGAYVDNFLAHCPHLGQLQSWCSQITKNISEEDHFHFC